MKKLTLTEIMIIVIALIVPIGSIILIYIGLSSIGKEIQNNGLKSIVNTVWNGSGNK